LRAAGLAHRGVDAVAVLARILVVVAAELELARRRAAVAVGVAAVVAVLRRQDVHRVLRRRVDLAVAARGGGAVEVAVPRIGHPVALLLVVRAHGVLVAVAANVEGAVGLAVAVVAVVGHVVALLARIHSFPTRRSSDLLRAAGLAHRGVGAVAVLARIDVVV